MAKSKIYLTEEKAQRIAVGATVGGALLIFFLVIVLIVQFVQIGVKKSENQEYKELIKQYQTWNKDGKKDLEYYQTEAGLYNLAWKEGWKKK